MSRTDVVRAIEASGVVAVIRLKDAGKLRSVVDALIEGGVTAMEVTMTVPGAVEVIRDLNARFGRDVLLGAGTVLSPEVAVR